LGWRRLPGSYKGWYEFSKSLRVDNWNPFLGKKNLESLQDFRIFKTWRPHLGKEEIDDGSGTKTRKKPFQGYRGGKRVLLR